MPRKPISFTQHYHAVMNVLTSDGLLLGAYDAQGKPNVMTIGWAAAGSIWGMPMWTVLVRPSRYTYGCIERGACFTVNVPTKAMRETCLLCGTKSGRDVDKFAECGLTAENAETVHAPLVAECPVVYECSVVHAHDVLPDALADEIRRDAYPQGDFHRVYYGRILAAAAEPDADTLLQALNRE